MRVFIVFLFSLLFLSTGCEKDPVVVPLGQQIEGVWDVSSYILTTAGSSTEFIMGNFNGAVTRMTMEFSSFEPADREGNLNVEIRFLGGQEYISPRFEYEINSSETELETPNFFDATNAQQIFWDIDRFILNERLSLSTNLNGGNIKMELRPR
ncbi:hypothetical protein QWY85_05010 [Neolewinella lacunae]|uniref:Uncharacterized protein n=1 Tax=Neolewinella lacunae TaxID=1517758 RepID=A0A923PSU0_9BACT|nr:hypothetical protein [Neolewinella lacunae]MBC6996157.1 hypothetical protein [Neolewinella lacunae]MDN3634008.1 hypothetical protein [Neolewinella lacunae]